MILFVFLPATSRAQLFNSLPILLRRGEEARGEETSCAEDILEEASGGAFRGGIGKRQFLESSAA